MDKVKTEFKNNSIVESRITLSKDKRFFIHKTIITDIKPMAYINKVMGMD